MYYLMVTYYNITLFIYAHVRQSAALFLISADLLPTAPSAAYKIGRVLRAHELHG